MTASLNTSAREIHPRTTQGQKQDYRAKASTSSQKKASQSLAKHSTFLSTKLFSISGFLLESNVMSLLKAK